VAGFRVLGQSGPTQVTPLPGTSRDSLLNTLRNLSSLLGRHSAQTPRQRTGEYLDWATSAADQLAYLVSAEDVARLVLTPGYDRLLGTMSIGGSDVWTSRVLNGMLSAEEEQRKRALGAAVRELEAQAARWASGGRLVVPDSSFYLCHAGKLEDTDFAGLLDSVIEVNVIVPMVVIDELDRLKETGQVHPQWRAGHTLAVIDRVLAEPARRRVMRPGHGVVMSGGSVAELPAGDVTLEILFDPPGHVRLPVTDDEIVDPCCDGQGAGGPGRDVDDI
jgi:hypothetical protein